LDVIGWPRSEVKDIGEIAFAALDPGLAEHFH